MLHLGLAWFLLSSWAGFYLKNFVCPVCQVTAQTEEVIRCRVHQRNMATTVEKLQLCIPGASRVPARMMNHRGATALKLNDWNVFYAQRLLRVFYPLQCWKCTANWRSSWNPKGISHCTLDWCHVILQGTTNTLFCWPLALAKIVIFSGTSTCGYIGRYQWCAPLKSKS